MLAPLIPLRPATDPSPACGPSGLFALNVQPFGGRRPGPRRLVKAPVAVHPLPSGEGRDPIPSLSPRERGETAVVFSVWLQRLRMYLLVRGRTAKCVTMTYSSVFPYVPGAISLLKAHRNRISTAQNAQKADALGNGQPSMPCVQNDNSSAALFFQGPFYVSRRCWICWTSFPMSTGRKRSVSKPRPSRPPFTLKVWLAMIQMGMRFAQIVKDSTSAEGWSLADMSAMRSAGRRERPFELRQGLLNCLIGFHADAFLDQLRSKQRPSLPVLASRRTWAMKQFCIMNSDANS